MGKRILIGLTVLWAVLTITGWLVWLVTGESLNGDTLAGRVAVTGLSIGLGGGLLLMFGWIAWAESTS